jgi:hypothetical protein
MSAMVMEIPEEFIELCGYIDGLSHVREDTVVQWVAGAVNQFNHVHPQGERGNAVRQFLDEVLSGSRDGAELQKIWHQAGAGFFIADHQELRQLFELIRDEMNRKRSG